MAIEYLKFRAIKIDNPKFEPPIYFTLEDIFRKKIYFDPDVYEVTDHSGGYSKENQDALDFLYLTKQVLQNRDIKEIKDRFKRLSKLYHPDMWLNKGENNDKKMKELNKAYKLIMSWFPDR